MNNLNLDPGLRKAFTQQTYQRLLSESTQARRANSVTKNDQNRFEVRLFCLKCKIEVISQVIQDAAVIIASVMRANVNSASV
jgi:hypothetical protein